MDVDAFPDRADRVADGLDVEYEETEESMVTEGLDLATESLPITRLKNTDEQAGFERERSVRVFIHVIIYCSDIQLEMLSWQLDL